MGDSYCVFLSIPDAVHKCSR